MNTAIQIFLLVDYEEYYGTKLCYDDARELIRGIPSLTLLHYLSGFDVNCYLNDNSDSTGNMQGALCQQVLSIAGEAHMKKWNEVVLKCHTKGFNPYFIYNYSTLLFYGLIFKEFNDLPGRNLTSDEAKRLFDAYLILNGQTNSRIVLTPEEETHKNEESFFEDVLMSKFAYQKDFTSTIDFSNQVVRGATFFEYLERHPKYKTYLIEYYTLLNVSGWKMLLRSLICIFSELGLHTKDFQKNHLVNLERYNQDGDVELPYINQLIINPHIDTYQEDESFSLLRNHMLCKISPFAFFVLDVNFFIDQFYKAQVFKFNSFLKSKGIIDETFLSEKAKGFMEDTNLQMIISICFPIVVKYFGDQALNSTGTELCDVYMRSGKMIGLIEFKDVLISAKAKNSGDQKAFFKELDLKFYENQKKKAKGIRQLLNAIEDVEKKGISFDEIQSGAQCEIFPIILYTDSTLGNEGINKRFTNKFRKDLEKLQVTNHKIHDPTFINLNFFELQQDLFEAGMLDFFDMLTCYHEHIKAKAYQQTPFEVFSRFYMRENLPDDVKPIKFFSKVVSRILKEK